LANELKNIIGIKEASPGNLEAKPWQLKQGMPKRFHLVSGR